MISSALASYNSETNEFTMRGIHAFQYTYEELIELKQQIRFKTLDHAKEFIWRIDDGKQWVRMTVKNNILTCRCDCFKCCPFTIKIIPVYCKKNKKWEIINYRVKAIREHNHSKMWLFLYKDLDLRTSIGRKKLKLAELEEEYSTFEEKAKSGTICKKKIREKRKMMTQKLKRLRKCIYGSPDKEE